MSIGFIMFILYLTSVSFALYFTFRDKRKTLFIFNLLALILTILLNFFIYVTCIIPVATIISSVSKQMQRKIIDKKLKNKGGDKSEIEDSV